MEKTCRLVHITYRENNRDPGQEEYKQNNALRLCLNIRHNDRVSLVEIHSRSNLISLEQCRCIQLLSLLLIHSESHSNVFEIPARNSQAADI